MFPQGRCRPGLEPGPIATNVRGCSKLELQPGVTTNIGGYRSLRSQGRRMERPRYFFAAAARSTKVLPPFILWASGASLIWITTASASTPRFLTSAWVMSRIMPAFCSSVRPAAMLTVISGIVVSPFALAASLSPHTQFSSLHNGFAVIAGGAAARPRLEGWPIVLMVRDGASAPPHHEVLI